MDGQVSVSTHQRPSLLIRNSVTTASPIYPPALDPTNTYTHASPSAFHHQGLIIDKNKGNTLKVDRHRYVKVVGEAGGKGRGGARSRLIGAAR